MAMDLTQAKALALTANVDVSVPGWLQKLIDLLKAFLSIISPTVPTPHMKAKAGCDPSHYDACLKTVCSISQAQIDGLEMLKCCSDNC